MNTQTLVTETHTCDCSVCKGLAFTAPVGYVTGTSKQVRDMVHNYAQHAHGASPLSRVLSERAGIKAV